MSGSHDIQDALIERRTVNHGSAGGKQAEGTGYHGRPYSLLLNLPPLSIVVPRKER